MAPYNPMSLVTTVNTTVPLWKEDVYIPTTVNQTTNTTGPPISSEWLIPILLWALVLISVPIIIGTILDFGYLVRQDSDSEKDLEVSTLPLYQEIRGTHETSATLITQTNAQETSSRIPSPPPPYIMDLKPTATDEDEFQEIDLSDEKDSIKSTQTLLPRYSQDISITPEPESSSHESLSLIWCMVYTCRRWLVELCLLPIIIFSFLVFLCFRFILYVSWGLILAVDLVKRLDPNLRLARSQDILAGDVEFFWQ